jgi:hypothetical protein
MSGSALAKTIAAVVVVVGIAAVAGGAWWLQDRDKVASPPPPSIQLDSPARAFSAPSGSTGIEAEHGFKRFPKAAFIGDTYGMSLASESGRGWVDEVTANMCWSVSGKSIEMRTGYTNPGTGGTAVFAERIDDVARTAPSIVVIEGGLHDYDALPDKIYEAARNVFATGRATLPPETMIVAVGPPKPPTVSLEDATHVLDPLARAAADNGVVFINPAAENWLPDGSFFHADGFLLNAKGHQEFARRLTEQLRALGAPAGC